MTPTTRPTVAIDVTPLLGARSGIGVAVAEIVAAFRALDAGPHLVPYTLSARARLHRADAPVDTRFVPVPARVLLRAWTRSELVSIDRWIKPAQVVHATNYLTPPSKLPTLVSVYDCSFVRYPELCTPEVRAFEPIVRRAIARGATVHTGSTFVAGEIEEIFGPGLAARGQLVVIPLGVPALGEASDLPPDLATQLEGQRFVLAIGTLEPRKNYAHLIAAFGRLAERVPDLLLVIAGHDGPDRPGVDRAIARLSPAHRDRVIITGSVSDATRRALLDRAAALAYPSIYEGFGFPVLEAMSVGVAVVAARAGSIPEVAGDAALLVEPTDEAALADALERVVDDDATRAELVARGRDRIRAFSWDETARALAACYRKLAG
ncbi:MAG TPA: glycosyltransferase family 1 protein [Acidimicrobiia bacterium]|nr:glycosyltransferase family 1 protein [Acidimicrobiia bacterium]